MWFSDWRGAPQVDYSTNALVSNYYSGGHARYFRVELWDRFKEELERSGELTIGIDYYAMFNLSSPLVRGIVGDNVYLANFNRWQDGGVDVFTIQIMADNLESILSHPQPKED